jgi:hypothetical protein
MPRPPAARRDERRGVVRSVTAVGRRAGEKVPGLSELSACGGSRNAARYRPQHPARGERFGAFDPPTGEGISATVFIVDGVVEVTCRASRR